MRNYKLESLEAEANKKYGYPSEMGTVLENETGTIMYTEMIGDLDGGVLVHRSAYAIYSAISELHPKYKEKIVLEDNRV